MTEYTKILNRLGLASINLQWSIDFEKLKFTGHGDTVFVSSRFPSFYFTNQSKILETYLFC
jgi:hypothetical protein